MKCVYCLHQWPDATETAAGKRSLQLISAMKNKGWEVLLLSTAELSSSYQLKYSANTIQFKANTNELDEIVCEYQPDIVIFDRFISEEMCSWRIRHHFPDALYILDTQDLHFLRKARQTGVKEATTDTINLHSDIAKREIASILRCDLTLVISQPEKELLENTFSVCESQLAYFPLLFSNQQNEGKDFKQRKDFVFVGNGLHEPNVSCIRRLKKEVWPRIKALIPEAKLHIYGAYLKADLLDLTDQKMGFIVHGKTEELAHVLSNAKVMLAPLEFGAGQKGKLLDAMEHYLPSITTSIGMEGMCDSVEHWPGFVCDDKSLFVEAAVEVYNNEALWLSKVNKINSLLQKNHNLNLANDLMEKFVTLKTHLYSHRKTHFIIQIMNANLANSYKYLSKWIALKNQTNGE